MTEAEQIMRQFVSLPSDFIGAIYLAVCAVSTERAERFIYFDPDNSFLFVTFYYDDGSSLRIHRNRWVRAYDGKKKFIRKYRLTDEY